MKIEHFQLLSAMIAAGAVYGKYGMHDTYSITNKDGVLHSENLPAQIRFGPHHFNIHWYINGKAHREGGPAYIDANGEGWIIHGQYHRSDGPAKILYNPKVTTYGIKEVWYKHGVVHREGGPAKTYFDGRYPPEYWINGERI